MKATENQMWATLEFNINYDFDEADLISSGEACTFESIDMTGFIITERNGVKNIMYSEVMPTFSPFTGEILKVKKREHTD